MGLNNTAAFIASCVAFVSVYKGMVSHHARRRREAAVRLLEQSQSRTSVEDR
jgi:hypothetical protein